MSRVLARVPRRGVETWPKETPELWQKTEALWTKITLFVACPAMVLVGINTYLAEAEHRAHYKRPPFIPYDHLYKADQRYPWGDGKHPLLFNPKINATRKGYETEE